MNSLLRRSSTSPVQSFFYSFHCRPLSDIKVENSCSKSAKRHIIQASVFFMQMTTQDYHDYSNGAPAESKNTFRSRCVCARRKKALQGHLADSPAARSYTKATTSESSLA